jgi:hypothetical protein
MKIDLNMICNISCDNSLIVIFCKCALITDVSIMTNTILT